MNRADLNSHRYWLLHWSRVAAREHRAKVRAAFHRRSESKPQLSATHAVLEILHAHDARMREFKRQKEEAKK